MPDCISIGVKTNFRKKTFGLVSQYSFHSVDDGGSLLYLQRLDGTQTGSIDVALQKAKTAVHFKRPSKALEDAVTGGRTVVLALGAMPIEGGLPLMVDDKLIGAIGVSGATAQQDGQVAKAGADALAKMLGK